MNKKTLFLLILFCISSACNAFTTLSELQKYINDLKESPVGKIDWINPDYSAFHKKISRKLPSILRFFGNKNDIAVELQAQLARYMAPLKQSKVTQKKIVKINSDAARVFVWGDIHGAIHSIERSLTLLHEQNIINEQLEIIKPDHYFIFNGNAINRSAYSIEMLVIILSLLEKNPDKVFYTCGKEEANKYWRNFSLKQELRIRAKHLSNDQVPLGKELDAFFATLPFAIYLSNPNNPTNVIRISHFSRTSNIINEQKCGTFFTDTKPGISYYDIRKKEKFPERIDVVALITTEDWKEIALVKEGLTLLEQDLGSITWGVFSSRTEIYKEYSNFFDDAFASIQVATPIEKSTISLINRDARTKNPFTMHEPLNIMSGMPAKDPRSYSGKPSIIIGSSMSLVQGVPVMGKMIKQGLMTRINKENSQQGGIDGRIIRVIVKNDDYSPQKARANIKEFIKQGIDITFLQVGTPTLSAYLDLVQEKKLIALFPVTGAPFLYAPEYSRVIRYRASYEDEVRALINYSYTRISDRIFTFFYQNDSYGLGPLDAAHKVLEKLGIKEWTDIPYARGSANLEPEATKIKLSGADTIGLFSTAQPTQELIRQIGIDQITNKEFIGISFLGEETFRQYINKHGIPITFGAVVPNPHLNKLEIIEEYRKEMKKNSYDYNVYSLEAYLATTIFIDAMKKIKGPINQDSVTDMLTSIKNLDLQGLKLSYNPARCDLAQYVYIELGDNQPWIEKGVSELY